MTKKVFWDDPYLTQLTTHVASVNGDQLTLMETIFYPFSGGQERDSGTIGGKTVLDAVKEGLEITYLLTPDHGFKAGDAVMVEIDWQRRYRLMRLHFAAEIILELVTQRLPNAQKIGAHIAVDKARIDFSWPENLTPILSDLSYDAQTLIDDNLPIISAFSDKTGGRRYWKIDGFAQVPCGGTHLKTTGEIGEIKLKRKNVGVVRNVLKSDSTIGRC
jgi:alanyl-tRNA synthetase